ncbi:MAG TPA: glycosyltransferase [Bacteroidales bacterium]|nr:glycosyltransferase [Bacteroidales bacterium]
MKLKRIIVSVSNDLSIDQRVDRICNSLCEWDYEVLLVGRKLKLSKKLDERNYKTKRFKLLFEKGVLFYTCLNIRLFFYLLFSKADIFLSNDLDTLPANALASFFRNKKLVYDSHELFTEVPELENKKFKKKIWGFLEKISFKRIDKAYTVCESIADFYFKKYGIKMSVVRNLPTLKNITNKFENRENIIIYQGALNKERGIDIMIKAMQHIKNAKLIIAGSGDLEQELHLLNKDLNLEAKVEFTGKLNFNDLFEQTQRAKLGLSLEQGKSLNYYYALPNKIFDYIQAGVPVICSDFPEMKNIVDNYKVGISSKISDEKTLAKTINELLDNEQILSNFHQNCIKAREELNWENEKEVLKTLF